MSETFNPLQWIQSLPEAQDAALHPERIHLAKKLPPVHTWNPPCCGDIPMRIDRQGIWYYQNSPITRHRMVQLFSRILRRDDDGCYYLVTPVEKVRIQVDDTPFVATQVIKQKEADIQQLIFTTQIGDVVTLNAQHLLRIEQQKNQSVPYLLIRDRLEARLHRNVYYQLVEWAIPSIINDQIIGVNSDGLFFELGAIN